MFKHVYIIINIRVIYVCIIFKLKYINNFCFKHAINNKYYKECVFSI